MPACPASAAEADDARILLFSGRDIWHNGAFAYGGFVFAPSGLDEDGLLLKVMLSAGIYRYNAQDLNGERVIGAEGLTQVLPGWRMKRGDVEFKVFMGPEIQEHSLWPDDPGNRLRGTSYGLRIAAEVWCEPTAQTMIAGDVSLSSIATSGAARIAYGWRLIEEMLGGLYIGPEIQYFGSDGYRHARLGAHITSMKAEDTEWSAAVGWARDSDGRSGPYVRLSVLARR
ncbi:MAG TPA: cellulose biosynthesis protein BcsS [Pseudolabrys sp.]|nr:cellulose biosynthesis protein BcsS [Pseudolabrys sp.]